MSQFRILLLKSFWLKLGVISWWSLALGSYAWFLLQLAKLGGWHEYLAVVTSFVMSGAGFNYITGLYKEETSTFSCQFALPPLLMSSGVAVLWLAALTGHYTHWAAQVLSVIMALAAVMLIVGGSAAGPKIKLRWSALTLRSSRPATAGFARFRRRLSLNVEHQNLEIVMPKEEEILRENKRECFDGMRAYHQSEINHANHAITMLLAVAAVVGAVVVAILFPQTKSAHVHEIAWGLFIVVLVLGATIAGAAHIKISGDHAVYAAFGIEYVKTSMRLGLYDSAVDGTDAIKTNRNIGQGKGYRKTQGIIWAFSCVLTVLTLLFAIAVSCIM